MDPAEAERIAQLRARDPEALDALYRQHVAGVWRYAFARTRCRTAAGEIVQETFCRALKGLRRFRGRSSVRTWLFTLVRAATADHLRRAVRQREQTQRLRLVAGDDVATPTVDASEAVERRRAAVHEAIAELPDAQREVVVLCELAELNTREVAAVLKWSEARVRVTLFRARRRLRELLAAVLAEEDLEATGIKAPRKAD